MGTEKALLKHEVTTAILVDGGFYRKRAYSLWNGKTPKECADKAFKADA